MTTTSVTTTTIPKQVNFIWLGGFVKEGGQTNILRWQAENPDYSMHLWIDSSTYPQTAEGKEKYAQLARWATENKVYIHDLNRSEKENDAKGNPTLGAYVCGESAFYESMLSRHFYDDEIGGAYRNLAAASDILRAEILYQRGGVYFDIMDVFPGENPLGNLNASEGFLVNISTNYIYNDVLASSPKGEIIAKFREAIDSNYKLLYDHPELLRAHRNPHFLLDKTSEYAHFAEDILDDSRFKTTLHISGPYVLQQVLQDLKGFDSSASKFEDGLDPFFVGRHLTPTLAFPTKLYKSFSNEPAASWSLRASFWIKGRKAAQGQMANVLTTLIDDEQIPSDHKDILKLYRQAIYNISAENSLLIIKNAIKDMITSENYEKIRKYIEKDEKKYFEDIEPLIAHIENLKNRLIEERSHLSEQDKASFTSSINYIMDVLWQVFYKNDASYQLLQNHQYKFLDYVINMGATFRAQRSSSYQNTAMEQFLNLLSNKSYRDIEDVKSLLTQFNTDEDKEFIKLSLTFIGINEKLRSNIPFSYYFPYFLKEISDLSLPMSPSLKQEINKLRAYFAKVNSLYELIDQYPQIQNPDQNKEFMHLMSSKDDQIALRVKIYDYINNNVKTPEAYSEHRRALILSTPPDSAQKTADSTVKPESSEPSPTESAKPTHKKN